jgi:DNA-binding Xre family transcriptional regulator
MNNELFLAKAEIIRLKMVIEILENQQKPPSDRLKPLTRLAISIGVMMSDKPYKLNITLSELIGIHRDRLHMSQTELARLSGVSRNYISLIERGRAENISLKTLYKICYHLGLNIEIFYDAESQRNGNPDEFGPGA